MENTAQSYEEKIKQQQELLKKLADEDKMNPSDETKLKITRETDTLRHLSRAAKGNPKARAERAAEFARQAAMGRAIEQPPPENPPA